MYAFILIDANVNYRRLADTEMTLRGGANEASPKRGSQVKSNRRYAHWLHRQTEAPLRCERNRDRHKKLSAYVHQQSVFPDPIRVDLSLHLVERCAVDLHERAPMTRKHALQIAARSDPKLLKLRNQFVEIGY
jgi:hypothetical protein